MKLFLLTVIFIISIHKFFSRDFCKEYCQNCCDCFKEKDEEEIILKKNNFKYNWDISKYKANIEDNLEEKIKKLNTESNAFKYLKIQEAIDVYNNKNNNELLRKNNLRNKIDQYKIIQEEDSDIKKYCDDREYNTYGGKVCNYDFKRIMDLFKTNFFFVQFFLIDIFFIYFYFLLFLTFIINFC